MKDFIQKLGFLLNISRNLSTDRRYLKTLRNIVKESSILNKNGEFGLPLFYSPALLSSILKKRVLEKYRGKFLLVTHEFSRTGAPMAGLMLAETIKKIYGEYTENLRRIYGLFIPCRCNNIRNLCHNNAYVEGKALLCSL